MSAWCVFHVFDCALSVCHLKSHIYILGLCVSTLNLRCHPAPAHGEFGMVSNQRIVDKNITWTHACTNLLGLSSYLTMVLFLWSFYRHIVWIDLYLSWEHSHAQIFLLNRFSNPILHGYATCMLHVSIRHIRCSQFYCNISIRTTFIWLGTGQHGQYLCYIIYIAFHLWAWMCINIFNLAHDCPDCNVWLYIMCLV